MAIIFGAFGWHSGKLTITIVRGHILMLQPQIQIQNNVRKKPFFSFRPLYIISKWSQFICVRAHYKTHQLWWYRAAVVVWTAVTFGTTPLKLTFEQHTVCCDLQCLFLRRTLNTEYKAKLTAAQMPIVWLYSRSVQGLKWSASPDLSSECIMEAEAQLRRPNVEIILFCFYFCDFT